MACPVQDMAVERSPSPRSSSTSSFSGQGWADSRPNRSPGGDVERRRAQVILAVPLACAGQVGSVREVQNSKKSAAPSRVLCWEGGAWNDLPPAVVEAVREGFAAGKSIVDVPLGGSPRLFDFARMVQMDVVTATQKPIGWVDVNGRGFFPRMADAGVPKMEAVARSDRSGGWTPSEDPVEERWDENRVVSCPGGQDGQNWEGLQVLDVRDRSYKVVERIFLTCMRRSAPATRITCIRKCSNGGTSRNSRQRVFQMWEQMTKAARGSANVKYGWYGAPAAAVTSAVRHGFGQPNNGCLRPAAEAVGVYIAPAHSAQSSAAMSDPDHAGEGHVVLCRVIVGNPEQVDVGSPRCHPSGDEFDSGVDDLEKPSWYIVWGTRMNTHILPEFVVSFKTSESGPRVQKGLRQGTWISLTRLFSELRDLVPSSRAQLLDALFSHFKAGKLAKGVFLRNLRAIAGDDLLAAIKRFHNHL